MYRIYATFIEIIAAAVFLIPILGLYGRRKALNLKQTLLYILFGFYLIAVLSLVGFPNVISNNLDLTINVIPFLDMIADYKNAFLNILLFLPLGIFLPMLWDNYRNIKKTLLFTLCSTMVIEVSQIFTFRTTDINDIITNCAGAILGYFVATVIIKRGIKYVEPNRNDKNLYFICGTVVIIMFALQPFVSSMLWDLIL